MTAHKQSANPDLPQLIAQLSDLIRLAEIGEWDAVAAMAPAIGEKLDALQLFVNNAPANSNALSFTRPQLAETIALIDKALSHCTSRRDQIAPLVNRLKPLADTPRA
jgi:ABC-type transporter Mla subunit MlaD